MKKAAVIGLGDISIIHLSAIENNPNVKLVAVCDILETARAKAPDEIPFFTDFEEMIRTTNPDCVHICLPHYLHYPVARKVAELGCNVFTEKPLAISCTQGENFAQLEKEFPKLKFGICLQNRLNDTTIRLKSIIESGEYGSVIGLKGLVPWFRPKEYYDVKPWRATFKEAGSGTLMNQSIHTLDLLYYFGGPIKKIHASMSNLSDYGIEVEDTVTARLEFENGAKGVFWATNCNYTNESVQITVALEKAVFHIEDGILTCRDENGKKTIICEDRRLPGIKFYYGISHFETIGLFYNALESGGEDYIHASDGVMSIRLIDTIIRSSDGGGLIQIQ